jgi:Cys-rich protein (TIGR01571 family)
MEATYSKTAVTASPSAAYYQEAIATGHAVEVAAYDPQSALTDNSGETFRFGGWEVGLCSCCTHCVPNCCMVCCCPCFSAAQIASRLGVMSFKVALIIYFIVVATLYVSASMVSYKSYDIYYRVDGYYYGGYHRNYYYYDERATPGYTAYRIVVVMAEVAAFVIVWQLRAKTRERFEIPGNCFCDCCATFWCSCCSMAQMATHIKSYKPGNCDFGPPDTLPAYPQREATPNNV